MAENKKIKKLQKVNRNSTIRFKKAYLKPERAQVGTINKPTRFCDDSDIYMMESDIAFGLKNNEVLLDVSVLNLFKHITSVEVRKDLSEKIVTFKLESQPDPPVTSWQAVLEDLEENETPAIKDWAESIQKFGPQYEKFIQDFEKFLKETPLDKKLLMREQSAYKRLRMFSYYPSFEMRYRMKDNQIKCSELCFNETFIQEAGYTIDNFTATVFAEGLPQLFPPDCPPVLAAIKAFMQNLNYENTEVKLPEQEADLLMKASQRKRVLLQPTMLMELTETDLILSLIFVVTMKSQPFGSYQKQSYSEEFLEVKRENSKEKEHLFETFYHGKVQPQRSNMGRVCKIKEISLSQK